MIQIQGTWLLSPLVLLGARCGMNHSHHFHRHMGKSPQIQRQVPL